MDGPSVASNSLIKASQLFVFCLLSQLVLGDDIKTTETKITKIHLDGHLMNNVTKRKVPLLTQYRFNEKLSDIFRRIFVNFTLDDN